jgi:hypothetical protein
MSLVPMTSKLHPCLAASDTAGRPPEPLASLPVFLVILSASCAVRQSPCCGTHPPHPALSPAGERRHAGPPQMTSRDYYHSLLQLLSSTTAITNHRIDCAEQDIYAADLKGSLDLIDGSTLFFAQYRSMASRQEVSDTVLASSPTRVEIHDELLPLEARQTGPVAAHRGS